MRLAWLVLGSAACATTTSVCPLGTNRVDIAAQQGRAQWCTTADPRLATIPSEGRHYTGALGSQPRPMSGGVQGPFTSWYPNGSVESHGHYLDFGSRSVPDGLWGFWYANGQRRMIGTYHRGEPAGCFAVWDEAGVRSTGFVEGEQLRVESCTPPADDELAIVEGGASEPAAPTAWGDVSAQFLFGGGAIGARNDLQIDRDPGVQTGIDVAVRKRLGRLRFGPTAALRISDNTDYRSLGVGGTLAVGLPALHPRLDAEAGLAVGAQHVTGIAMRPMQLGVADMAFWSPVAALQLGVSFSLSPYLEALVGARVEGAPTRDVDREVTYCNFNGCLAPQQETWQVGGFAYGVDLGLRLVIR